MKILNIVEATNINAVAKNVLDFYRSARELGQTAGELQTIEGFITTFDRSPSDGSESENEFVATVRNQGLGIDVIPERRRFDTSVIPALRKIVEERRPDLVVTHSVKSHFLMWRSRLARKYPWVAFHHGYTNTDRKMRLYNRLDRWSLPSANRLITVCQAFAEELAGTTSVSIERIAVLHNSIRPQPRPDTTERNDARSTLGIAANERIVLAVGRLSREKGHIDLLAAFNRLRNSNPGLSTRLIVVGDGPERAVLENVAASLGDLDRVTFAGQVKVVRPYYIVADVMVLPSHSEGSPNVLLEAMAANVPVVATAVGGVPEMVENNETALLVPARDAAALATAIDRILSDGKLVSRLTANASALVATRYSPDRYARTLVEIYREIVDQYRIQ